MTLLSYGLYEQLKKRQWKAVALQGAGAALFLFLARPWWLGPLQRFIGGQNQAVYEGIFLYGQNYVWLAWPVLAAGALGAYGYIKRREHSLPIVFLTVSTLWVVLHLPFYNRMLLYVDAAFILFAAQWFAELTAARTRRAALAAVLLLCTAYLGVSCALHKTPLIAGSELDDIAVRQFPPGSFVVALSADDAPWLLGYLPAGVRLAAPGLFEDRHTYGQWSALWAGQAGSEFFSSYPRPLFLYSRSYAVPEPLVSCTKKQDGNFSEFACP